MPSYQLHHVQLAIPQGGEPEARAFFGQVLGLIEIAKPAALAARGGCWFRSPAAGHADGISGAATTDAASETTDAPGETDDAPSETHDAPSETLHAASEAAIGGLELHLGVEEPFHPANKAHPGLLVGDLDDVIRRLTEAGYDAEPDELFPGYRRVYSWDPFGNRLEFLEPRT